MSELMTKERLEDLKIRALHLKLWKSEVDELFTEIDRLRTENKKLKALIEEMFATWLPNPQAPEAQKSLLEHRIEEGDKIQFNPSIFIQKGER